jgi:hypothetical protein
LTELRIEETQRKARPRSPTLNDKPVPHPPHRRGPLQCVKLDAFPKFKCGALRSLNLSGCRLLPDVQLRALMESSTQLTELNLSACASLRDVCLPVSACSPTDATAPHPYSHAIVPKP